MDKQEAYKVLQKAWVEENDVRKGDIVRVLRPAKSHEIGWVCSWNDGVMTKKVGMTQRIGKISNQWVNLSDSYNYPFFVLEIVDQPREKEEMIEIDGKKISKSTIKEALRNHIN